MSDRPVGRCIGCFHPFELGPCGGCGGVPPCPEHGVGLDWMTGQPVPGYAKDFLPVGWSCPADPGHPPTQANAEAPTQPKASEGGRDERA